MAPPRKARRKLASSLALRAPLRVSVFGCQRHRQSLDRMGSLRLRFRLGSFGANAKRISKQIGPLGGAHFGRFGIFQQKLLHFRANRRNFCSCGALKKALKKALTLQRRHARRRRVEQIHNKFTIISTLRSYLGPRGADLVAQESGRGAQLAPLGASCWPVEGVKACSEQSLE